MENDELIRRAAISSLLFTIISSMPGAKICIK